VNEIKTAKYFEMIKKIFFSASLLVSTISFAQVNHWTKIGKVSAKASLYERKYVPNAYKTYQLNVDGFKNSLKNAPQRFSNDESLVLKFPDAEGKMSDYVILEAPVLSKELQEKYPEIRSYVGYEKGNNLNTIRFSISPYDGLNVMYFNGRSTAYLDAYSKDNSTYIVYDRSAVPADKSNFVCGVTDSPDAYEAPPVPQSLVQDGLLRTYRLAVATTIEYSAYYINRAGLQSGTEGQKKAAVLAGINATMTRVNGVYEKTVSLTMQLIANNTDIIYITSDNFTNDDPSLLIDESQAVIDSVIGLANYDIGHTFSTQGGGLAGLRVPCTASKARGITGITAPIGDAYDIDYVAHEMGHQFGATHTFDNSCGGNRTASTSVEPGSGSTIMAYAGICPPDVQYRSDPYFHVVSVNQIYTNIFSGNSSSCPVKSSNNNQVPVVDAGPDYNIPYGTAFVLTGTASDPDGDALTYLWEQTDVRTPTNSTVPSATQTNGAVFRSYLPKTVPERYFPVMSSIVANNLTPTWEVIPSVQRNLNFALLVNDEKATGNQSKRDNVLIKVANTGPFKVTSQSASSSVLGDTSITVTWDVAGTNASPINVANVKILLSKDGGYTYPFTLSESTPNTGSANVTVPNEAITSARIMVKAVDNVFFALNASNFSITKNLAVNDVSKKGFAIYPNPAKGQFSIELAQNGKAEYQIFDMSGRLLKKGQVNSQENISISDLKTGNYRVVVSTEGKTNSQNLIVK